MKVTEIIKKGTYLQGGIRSLFIADKDFIYQGLPLLKNSLIYYNGKNAIQVNMVELALFQEANIPELITAKLHQDDKFNYLVDKCSNCESEITKLKANWFGIWHENHFDNWSGSFADYIERISESPVIEYSGITFSSLMYKYNTLTSSLDYFINVKPISLEIGNKLIKLPAFLEISREKTSYVIIPLRKTFEYHNFVLQGVSSLSEEGILISESAEEFDVEIFGHNEFKNMIISKGNKMYISSNGDVEIEIYNNKTNKIEKYRIDKVSN
ncbi:MAG: hypothetical protein K0B10_01315 [Vicingaceae bacterium]|nr:hypothetical protein [Vicingaceae bacterium]